MVFGFAFVAKTEQNLLLRLIFVIAGAPLCLYLSSPPSRAAVVVAVIP
ncbi:MAG: hypothetical protein LBH84_07060 [Prevotellaceae bacterium]|jgi:hypothetical protein|nr:hypothetical protein [Prevotellaceae bacterium]